MESKMEKHLYVSLIPEALIASHLTPEEFGVYYAVGGEKRSRGKAMFFELDPSFRHDFFDIEDGLSRCVLKEGSHPKRSVYISIYRVLEHIPVEAIKELYLVTQDGRTLGLTPKETVKEKPEEKLFLYQEIAPVHPLVATSMPPVEFVEKIILDPDYFTIPALVFADLKLGELAYDPLDGEIGDLPYTNINHLRECLASIPKKIVKFKIVDRVHSPAIPYRMINSGIYYCNSGKTVVFEMPSAEILKTEHNQWRRSANM
jgi:hypothetical protein